MSGWLCQQGNVCTTLSAALALQRLTVGELKWQSAVDVHCMLPVAGSSEGARSVGVDSHRRRRAVSALHSRGQPRRSRMLNGDAGFGSPGHWPAVNRHVKKRAVRVITSLCQQDPWTSELRCARGEETTLQ
jgi:hypothetical protein